MKIRQWLFELLRKQRVRDGRTDARTDGRENSIPPTNKVCGGYNEGTRVVTSFSQLLPNGSYLLPVLTRSSPKPNAANPSPHWCFWWNLIMICQLISEIFMFESVEGRTDRGRLASHTISSPWAFGSGKLKIDFLLSQPKHMLWVLKGTISMIHFFWVPKIC